MTQAQIDAQLMALNLAFSGFYDNDGNSIDSGFRFVLAGVTRTFDPAWYDAQIGSNTEREMKRALTQGGLGALNYYSSTAEDYLGWAYLPGLTRPREYLDGVVVDWESMPGTSTRYEDRYDLGFTAVHEVGHWLGLDHTFYRGCSAKGDDVQDTEPMKEPTNGCPAGKDTCPTTRASTRSTTSWTTRTTRATSSSRRARWRACRPTGSRSATARRDGGREEGDSGPPPGGIGAAATTTCRRPR